MIKKLLIILFAGFLFAGCAGDPTADCKPSFVELNSIDVDSLPVANTELTVEVVELGGPYKIGETVILGVRNNSDSSIVISLEKQVKIFKDSDGDHVLVSIGNKTNYIPSEMILDPEGGDFSANQISIVPDIENRGEQEEITVYIEGNEYRDGFYCPKNFLATVTFTLEP